MQKSTNNFNLKELNTIEVPPLRCGICDLKMANARHHILARHGVGHSSFFNSMSLCNYTCHINIHGRIMQKEQQDEFLNMRARYLFNLGYTKLKDIDIMFLNEYWYRYYPETQEFLLKNYKNLQIG